MSNVHLSSLPQPSPYFAVDFCAIRETANCKAFKASVSPNPGENTWAPLIEEIQDPGSKIFPKQQEKKVFVSIFKSV